MKYSTKIALTTFITTLAFFVLIGIVSGGVLEIEFIVGSLVISLLVSIVMYLIVSLYLHFFARNSKIPQTTPQSQNPSMSSIPGENRHILRVRFIAIIIVPIIIIFISSNLLQNTSTDIKLQNESLPELNIKIREAQKVYDLKGQVSYDSISFGGDLYLATVDGQNKFVYKLRGGNATRISGLPDQFYALKFKPAEQGLIVIVWPTEAKNVKYYLIRDTTATKITSNYPPELSVDKIFGNGKVKVGLTDNDLEKKIYFFNSSTLFDSIDIHKIKYPDIIVTNNDLLANAIIPQTYIVSGSEFSTRDSECTHKIYYIDDKNPSLREIQTTQNMKIENICHYLVVDKRLWFTTRVNDTAVLWKLNNKIATKIDNIVLDDAQYYDNDATAYNFKIAPSLEIIDNVAMVNTGRNRYVVDGDKLKHVQNIAFGTTGYSGMIIAHIKDYLFAGCSDSGFGRFRLCKYDLKEDPIQEKYIGTIDRAFISQYKSLYDDEYYIVGSTELATTKYYHLYEDKLTRVNKEINVIINPNRYTKGGHIDIIRKGLIDRYQIPNQYKFSEYEIGSDADGAYYPASMNDAETPYVVFYLPKE